MDSCRYDSFTAASTPHADRFAAANKVAIERRYSYASWTAPSHYAYLMGMVPHSNPAGVFASQVYKADFRRWSDRLGTQGLDFSKFVPYLSLPKVLKGLGYHTVARVSLPVLNELTLLSTHFNDYQLMENHNDFRGMIEEMTFTCDHPHFYFFNLGETHYPYMLTEEALPHVSGVHGVLKRINSDTPESVFFDQPAMNRLRAQQVKCVEYVDSLLQKLLCKCPVGTHVILTADHGELFGESNYFGHGPIMHEKVFEVPFVEGKVTKDIHVPDPTMSL